MQKRKPIHKPAKIIWLKKEIVYCCGKNYINKVDGVIKKSDELSIFFYPYFLFRVMEWITARNKLKNFEEIGNITKE